MLISSLAREAWHFRVTYNGNFLGIIELLSHYDTALVEHVARVKESQDTGKLIQAH